MKKTIVMLLVMAVAFAATPAFAQRRDVRGASAIAVEKASDQAIFHRVSDWFATRGKSPEEAKAIRTQRQADRAAARVQRESAQQRRQMEREDAKAQQGMRGRAGR